MSKKYTSIGGQALIEGIMMRGPKRTVIAVRKNTNEIEIVDMPEKHLKDKIKFLGWPIIRGAINFVESMITGYKAMMISADKSGFTEIEEEQDRQKRLLKENKKRAEKGLESLEEAPENKAENAIINTVMVIAAVLGVVLAVALFMYLPRLLVDGLQWLFKTDFSVIARSLIEQLIKLIVFVSYVLLVSFMKDIRRVFQYHGAEHKTIFCYEAGEELTVENVKKQSRFHPRCGTSFMILMIIISFLVSVVIQNIFPAVYNLKWVWVIAKILLIPITCGLGYEVLKICGKYDNLLTRIIAAPGLWMQRITTKEPEDDMIEVAISSIKAVIPENDNGELA